MAAWFYSFELYALLDDGLPGDELKQLVFEISSEQCPELEKMKGLMFSLEVTGKNHIKRSLEAHFYVAPGNSVCHNRCMYACPSSDARSSHLESSNAIGKSLGDLPARIGKVFRGSWRKG